MLLGATRARVVAAHYLQDAKAAISDPNHVAAQDCPEATFLPSLFSEFLQTLLSIVPSNGGAQIRVAQSYHKTCRRIFKCHIERSCME